MTKEIRIPFVTNARQVAAELNTATQATREATRAVDKQEQAVKRLTQTQTANGKTGIRGAFKALGGIGGPAGMLGGLSERLGLSPALGALAVGAVALRAGMQAATAAYRHNVETLMTEATARSESAKLIREANAKRQSIGLSAADKYGDGLKHAVGFGGAEGLQTAKRLREAGVRDAEESAAIIAQLPKNLRESAEAAVSIAARTKLIGGLDTAKFIQENQSQFANSTITGGITAAINDKNGNGSQIHEGMLQAYISNLERTPLTGTLAEIDKVRGLTALSEQSHIGSGGVAAARREWADTQDGGLSAAQLENFNVQREQRDIMRGVYDKMSAFDKMLDVLQGADGVRVKSYKADRMSYSGADH